jgi:FkbM family methyltransferase
MSQGPRAWIKRLARTVGFDIVRHPGPATTGGRRMMQMRSHGVDLVVDVGANIGQYAKDLRADGYRGAMISIEPLPEAYDVLARTARADRSWRTINCAIGRVPGMAIIHVAENSVSSSMLPILQSHVAAAPTSQVVGSVDVPVRTLDTVLDEAAGGAEHVFVKVDTQGFELEVLEGAAGRLDDVVGVEVEMSLVPLYKDAPTMPALVEWLERHGFWLGDLTPEFADPNTGRLLQVNGLFFRPKKQDNRA